MVEKIELLNKKIDLIKTSNFVDVKSLIINSSIIQIFDSIACELEYPVIIENSIIHNFNIYSCWFKQGLYLNNCIVHEYVDYQSGGHNNKDIIIQNNIFINFFNFTDCQFNEKVIVQENVFKLGTNLMGNIEEGFKNTFKKGILITNNVGKTDINDND